MSRKLIKSSTLTRIADAIREKTYTTNRMNPTEMPDLIESIQSGTDTSDATMTAEDLAKNKVGYAKGQRIVGTHEERIYVTQEKAVSPTESLQNVTPDADFDALSKVTVNPISSTYVGSGVTRQSAKTVTPTKTSQTAVVSGVYTTANVMVGPIPNEYIVPSGSQTLVANDTYDVTSLSSVTVNVPKEEPKLQSKSVTPTESEQKITPDSTYEGLSSVNVGAISSTYVGSGITRNPTPTVNGKTVTIPSGYYSSQTTKDVSSGSVTVNKPTVNSSGLVTASATVSAGYISGNPTNNTLQLTTQAAKAVTPSKSSQTAVASGVYTTGAVTVNAIPSEYIIPSGSQTATGNGTFDVTSLAQFVVNVSGGLPAGISAIAVGDDVVSAQFTTTKRTVTHNLGVTPDLVLYFAAANIAQTYSMLFAMRGSVINYRSGYNSYYVYHGNNATNITVTNSNNASYGVGNLTSTTFQVASTSTSYYWRAATYKWIAIKF